MPATPAIPAGIIAKIKARNQSVRFVAVLREVRQFRSFCCQIDSDAIMGVSKIPVVVLSLSPNPVCLGIALNWNFAGSYAPGSTISSRAIDFGDGTVVDPAGTSGTHTYATAGTFTVTATVREGGGTEQTISEEVNVIDCANLLLLSNIYAATDGSGVFYFE